ncbi:Hypothetical predicted protein [Podarcis lilfordi]|uniref:Uncharacterized protein n=1 Tax=Podarcis lilfordi TaxID=74358 RepID=A0AA35JS00_9SAUR|nr:Hypothetical predicted protein [Podarcis lilfordi]
MLGHLHNQLGSLVVSVEQQQQGINSGSAGSPPHWVPSSRKIRGRDLPSLTDSLHNELARPGGNYINSAKGSQLSTHGASAGAAAEVGERNELLPRHAHTPLRLSPPGLGVL